MDLIFAHRTMIPEIFTGEVKEIESGKRKKSDCLCKKVKNNDREFHQNVFNEQS